MKRVLCICFFFSTLNIPAQRLHLPEGFVSEEYIVGLSQPTAMTFAPDGRIFVAEKAGAVRIIENDKLLPEAFYHVDTETPNERGLDGIILDPDFDQNQFVYLFYTAKDERRNKVARVTAAGNTAIPNSEVEIMRFSKLSASWHNGGAMVFGNDGKLFVALGDGTNWTKAPRLDYLLGKIVRINPDGTIPADNPLMDQTSGEYQSIYAYGVRNPYTMAKSKSGRIFFNDVGNQEFEEVNELKRGANYGWNTVEGYLDGTAPDSRYVDPIHVYDHSDEVKCAVVGAAFYEPFNLKFPDEYHGKFFFMDYCAGTVWYMDPDTYETKIFAEHFDFPNNLAVGDDGHLYIMQLKTGQIFRISYLGSGAPFIVSQPQSKRVAEGDDVVLEVLTAGQEPLDFEWYRDGNILPAEALHQLYLDNVSLDDSGARFSVLVSNELGSVLSDTAFLNVVSGTYPQAQITAPDPNEHYRAGDTIFFSGFADDMEDGILPSDQLMWTIEFHHDVHTHPAYGPAKGLDSGFYAIGVLGEVDTNVFYRVHLEAVDHDGLANRKSLDLQPERVTLRLVSNPEGIEINVDGSKVKTNTSLRSVANLHRTLEVPRHDIVDDHLYIFDSWHDGEKNVLVRTFPATDQLEIGVNYLDSGFYHTGNGSKLQADFYIGIEDDTIYYNTQQKDIIDENWDVVSPYRWQKEFPDDSFSVKWTGEIIPPISGHYTFHVLHDSRVTLAVGDSILIDGHIDSSDISIASEASIWLEGGRKYEFQLFYEHFRKIARVLASWSYAAIENEIIPASQFQELDLTIDTIVDTVEAQTFNIFPNPVAEGKLRVLFDGLPAIPPDIYIHDNLGKLVKSWIYVEPSPLLSLNVSNLLPGIYSIQLELDGRTQVRRFTVY